jgi:hypothetical protein
LFKRLSFLFICFGIDKLLKKRLGIIIVEVVPTAFFLRLNHEVGRV